jgi:glyoxylase-like metal-dependent hydrolase (beta-lactamase superfamily II)
LILTHAHPDHIGGAKSIKQAMGCKTYLHLIVLRNERYILLNMTELVNLPEMRTEGDLYPEGFTATRFAAIIEGNKLWSMLATAPPSNDETSLIMG